MAAVPSGSEIDSEEENNGCSDDSSDDGSAGSSDFDLNDNLSDRSFSSDTDSDADDDYTNNTESTLGALDSQATCVDDEFWSDNLRAVDVVDFDEEVGPDHRLQPDSSVVQFFFLMCSETFFQVLAEQTNLYARQRQQHVEDGVWYETTPEEMMAFVALQILMGVVQMPRLQMYWSENKYIGNQGFKDTMPIRRFSKLLQYFHVNDNTAQGRPGTQEYDRLHKIKPLLDHTRQRFRKHMKPSKCQAVDEGMIRYKGRHYAKQYMPDKPVKRGLKVWMRCGSDGYCHDYRPYLGKHDVFKGRGIGTRVVLHMCRQLKWKYHHVYFDRFFTSLNLVRTLEDNGIYSCGTIKKDAKGFPDELRNPSGLDRGETIQRQHGNLVATVWKDKKLVHLLSTTSDPVGDGPVVRRVRGGDVEEFLRPPPVSDYQAFMSGVDRTMQHRAKNPVGRPAKKFWKYLVNYILELCLINSFLIWKSTPGTSASRSRYSLLDFRLDVAKQLIGGFSARKLPRTVPRLGVPAVADIAMHQSIRLQRKRSTCKLCTRQGEKKRKETVYGCSVCQVHLCQGVCFQTYHGTT